MSNCVVYWGDKGELRRLTEINPKTLYIGGTTDQNIVHFDRVKTKKN